LEAEVAKLIPNISELTAEYSTQEEKANFLKEAL
jgi:hypothetical protein